MHVEGGIVAAGDAAAVAPAIKHRNTRGPVGIELVEGFGLEVGGGDAVSRAIVGRGGGGIKTALARHFVLGGGTNGALGPDGCREEDYGRPEAGQEAKKAAFMQ